MVWHISPIDLIIFAGVFQGILLSIIWFIKANNKSQFILAFFLLTLSFKLLLNSKICLNFLSIYPIFVPLFDCLPFLFPPLMYFYIYFSTQPQKPFKLAQILHFIPPFFNIIFHLFLILLFGMEYFRSAFLDSINGSPPIYQKILLYMKILSAIVYIFYTLKVLIKFSKTVGNSKNNKSKKRWYYWLIVFYISTWLIVFIIYGLPDLFFKITPDLIFIRILIQTILFLLILYLITILAFTQPTIFNDDKAREKIKEKINFTQKEIDKIYNSIKVLMEDEIFTDPSLSLSSLAKEMNIHVNVLSFIINEKSQCNFSNFINTYRIEKFIKLAQQSNSYSDTYLSLAIKSGFNSKSTFNRIFKEIKNVTPSKYMKSLNK